MLGSGNTMFGDRRGFLASLAGGGLAGGLQAVLGDRIVTPHGIPIATEHGISADGHTDDGPAFERLFTNYEEAGATVVLPPGRYRIGGKLTVPHHISLAFTRGACIAGDKRIRLEGSIEAGPYQIFDGVRVVFQSGSACYALPQWWGARGDGTHDDTEALQSALNARIVFIPAGRYRTTRELVVNNRSTVVGVGNSWSPRSATDTWIQYDGPEDTETAVLRVSTAKVGAAPKRAVTNVHLEKIVLDGNKRAGYGLYSVYCSDDSSFSDITAIHCSQHGIFISEQWYSTYRNLVAKGNAGCGVTIGRVFDGWRRRGVNGLTISNVRAHRNGSDRRFHEKERRDWGYGVLFCPGGGTSLHNVVCEKNYGAGLIYDLSKSCSHRVEGGYLEKNGLEARADGAATRPWGLIVIGSGWARANSVSGLYLHGEVGDERAQAIWLTGDPPTGDLILRDISVGHLLYAEWDRYRFEGFIYYGIRSNIVGVGPRSATRNGEGDDA